MTSANHKNSYSRVRLRWPRVAIVILLIATSLLSMPMTETEVGSAVQTWVRYITADAREDAVIEQLEPHVIEGDTVAYIAHLASGGFCLCGADDVVLPVYLYCPKGTYDPQIPDYQFVLYEIAVRTKYVTEGLATRSSELLPYRGLLDKRASDWIELIAGRIPERMSDRGGRAAPDSMSVHLTVEWDQGSPYNNFCPVLTPATDEHCVVGCVATAMSQIMYYWQWPNTGQGNDNTWYYWRWRNNWDEEPLATDPGIPGGWGGRLEYNGVTDRLRMNGYWDESVYNSARGISANVNYRNALLALYNRLTSDSTNCAANFGVTNYQWGLMQDDHTDPPDAGDDAAATISYHAGIAVEMDYGYHGSGAAPGNVQTALEDHFRYDADATFGNRNIATMTEEIQWLRPFHFRGTNANGGGHSWMVVGYNKATDPNREFHMNLGWGGGNAWYTCDAIPGGYTIDQMHTTMIAPESKVRFVGDDNPGDGSPNDPYEDIEEAVAEAPDNVTFIFKAGSYNTFDGTSVTIDMPCLLIGRNATIDEAK